MSETVLVSIPMKPSGLLKVVRGYLPFEKFGERFAVTRSLQTSVLFGDSQSWRVSHIETGIALPGVFERTKLLAQQAGIALLDEKGEAKLKLAIAEGRKAANKLIRKIPMTPQETIAHLQPTPPAVSAERGQA